MFKVRDAQVDDLAFIFDASMRSIRNSECYKCMSNDVFYAHARAEFEELLARSRVLVACNPEDPSHVYGYIATLQLEPVRVVLYCYVKQPFRNFGVAKALLRASGVAPEDTVIAQYYTPAGMSWLRRCTKAAFYNPYLVKELV